MIGAQEEPTGEIPQRLLAGLLEEPTDPTEPTRVISGQVLAELVERCKPAPFVVTIRSPPKPTVTEEPPALIVSLPPRADHVAPVYTSRLMTVFVSFVITCGCALVVTMLVS
jgi:hypothetical protein